MCEQTPGDETNSLVIPYNDPDIKDEHEVIRRISNQFIVTDLEGQRISSMAHKASSGKNGGMSVDLKKLIELNDIDPKKYVTSPR